MPASGTFTLGKKERIAGKKLVETLFKGGVSRSMSCYPLRAVYALAPTDSDGSSMKMMVSVPKRCFRRAVKRNRVKRQVREAYRMQKSLVSQLMDKHPQQTLAIAFIWLSDQLFDSKYIEQRVATLLNRIGETL